ncbi:MAG: hypothetical protein WDO12_02795 [Pseudomonadota bacterium]
MDPKDKSDRIGLGLVAAANLCRALEIYVKILHFQHFRLLPEEHDLPEIISKLPMDSRHHLSETYEINIARSASLKISSFTLSNSERGWHLLEAPEPRMETFDDAIEHLSEIHLAWRRTYERLFEPQTTTLNFRALLAAIAAVDIVIAAPSRR